MAEQANVREQLDGLYGLTDELVRSVHDALEAGRVEEAARLAASLHAADLADLVEQLPQNERDLLLDGIKEVDADVFAHLDEHVREDVIDHMDAERVAEVVAELDSDDAVELIEDLEADEQREVLDAVPAEDRALLEDSLRYPEDSAGRMMRRELATVPSYWDVGQTIDHMRSGAELPDEFYVIFVVGPDHRPLGTVQLSRLLRAERPVQVTDIMDQDMRLLPATMDQEEVAFLFRQYGLVSAPVVDDTGRLIGAIDLDDVVDVIDEEAEEDILKLAGLREDDFYDAVFDTTRARFSWLLVNLGTAIVASIVIGFFDAAIEKVVALAILMPIVASMGGNAGTQTLTVAVRALAMKELTPANAMRIVGKEVLVGGINGVLFAAVMGTVAWFWFGDMVIGAVIGAAMIVNLVLAGFAGVVIPLALERMDIDPAVGSTVVLTTLTDVIGFFSFLGLAAWVLL
jgi:magnesium transporter